MSGRQRISQTDYSKKGRPIARFIRPESCAESRLLFRALLAPPLRSLPPSPFPATATTSLLMVCGQLDVPPFSHMSLHAAPAHGFESQQQTNQSVS